MKKQDIKELMKFFSSTKNITKMKLKQDDMEIELEKAGTQNQSQTSNQAQITVPPPSFSQETPQTIEPAIQTTDSPCITSPMVGTFYKAPAPGSEPFVKVGDSISKGQTVAIIEAMKIMNEIEAEYDCKITKILVEDGQPVEFDMPLFEVEKL